jgi:predicted nucleic acid-binding protein
MSALVFVDSNVFVYARQAHEPRKQPIAAQWVDRLWREQTGRTSIQVLNECYSALSRTARPTPAPAIVWEFVQSLLTWNPQPVDTSVFTRAHEIEERHRLNWWDCLIVAAAQIQGCSVLLTEDLQEGAVFGGVTVRSPFTLGISEDLSAYALHEPAVSAHRRRGRPRKLRSGSIAAAI